MTVAECTAFIRAQAASCGMTPEEWADSINRASKEDIARAMESLPTDVLEWAVKFEALSHVEKVEAQDDCANVPAQAFTAEAQEDADPQG